MHDSEQILSTAADWLRAGRGVALATVVTTWGSAPRPVGSKLAIDDSGRMSGSVSGGCIEEHLVERSLGRTVWLVAGRRGVREIVGQLILTDLLGEHPGRCDVETGVHRSQVVARRA